MTPEDQLPLLLKAFQELQPKPPPAPHLFVAGNRTFAIADFRRMADVCPDRDTGDVLHFLLDTLEGSDTKALREVQVRIEEQRQAALIARRLLKQVLRRSGIKRYAQVYELLKAARDELEY